MEYSKCKKNIEANKEDEILVITNKDELNIEMLRKHNPDWILPPEIYENFKCVVFHVSDVPNGRGGSPVQNQIADGLSETKISAIAVNSGLDTGDVYMKERLSLEGNAEAIFIRSSKIVFDRMIPYIISNNPVPIKQDAGGYVYKRRKPQDSELPKRGHLKDLFDHIRMLDAEGYPKAFLEWGNYRIEFDRVKLTVGCVEADVRITQASDV